MHSNDGPLSFGALSQSSERRDSVFTQHRVGACIGQALKSCWNRAPRNFSHTSIKTSDCRVILALASHQEGSTTQWLASRCLSMSLQWDCEGSSNQMLNVPGSIVTEFRQFSVGHLRWQHTRDGKVPDHYQTIRSP